MPDSTSYGRPRAQTQPPRMAESLDHLRNMTRTQTQNEEESGRDNLPPMGRASEPGLSRRRAMTGANPPLGGIHRRSTLPSRGIPSLAPRTSLTERTNGQFTLAGPEDTPQVHTAHEPFVQPGYADLNPSYEQANNAKPVWSLAKPLPRVVRPAMVPTKSELIEKRTNAQLPAENSQRLGLDVDPNEIEKGRIAKSASLRKIAAQVTDARKQREENFLNTVLVNELGSTAGPNSRISRTSSARRRPSVMTQSLAQPSDHLSAVDEGVAKADGSDQHEAQISSETLYQEGLRPEGYMGRLSEEDHDDHADFVDNYGTEDLDGLSRPLERTKTVLDQLNLDEAVFSEDLQPLVERLVEDEIHNNHTAWSVIRTHNREALAESLAVFIQLTIGFCANLSVTVAKAGNPNTTAWSWGLATMMAIYVSGGVSGAHLNPSITLMLWFYRGFPMRKIPEYFAAQFIGAFCAALAAYGVYYVSIQHYLQSDTASAIITSFVTSQRTPYINQATALFNEFMGTTILAVVIMALGDDQNAPPGAGMNALIVGLVVTCLSMSFVFETGGAFNPSRDFGPRLALFALGYGSKLFTNPYWFYGPWVGSICGAFTGAFLYDFMIFTGGESPVNYPLERSKRGIKRTKMNWKRRLRLNKADTKDITA